MLWGGMLAAVVAVAAFVLMVVGWASGDEKAGSAGLLVGLLIVGGWQTFARQPLLPWIRDRWRQRAARR